MYPIIFQTGQFTFYSHSLMSMLGIIAGGLLVYLLAKKAEISFENLFDNIILTALAGVIGAKIAFIVLYKEQFQSWTDYFAFGQGGLVSYGGMLLGAIFLVMLLRWQQKKVYTYLDLFSLGFFAGLFFGRIGDLLAGEYAGISSAAKYPIVGNVGAVPLPLMEAALIFVIVAVLTGLYLKFYRKMYGGTILYLSLLFYGLGRFLIDFYRDEDKIVLQLNLSQAASLVLFLFSVLMMIRIIKTNRRKYEING